MELLCSDNQPHRGGNVPVITGLGPMAVMDYPASPCRKGELKITANAVVGPRR